MHSNTNTSMGSFTDMKSYIMSLVIMMVTLPNIGIMILLLVDS